MFILSRKVMATCMRLVLISVGSDVPNHRSNGLTVKITSASVGSVVAVIVLVTFCFFMRKFWCKQGNSRPDAKVRRVILVICNQ